jgi:hypothetical protein
MKGAIWVMWKWEVKIEGCVILGYGTLGFAG